MNNLFVSDRERDFFVFIDPRDWLVRHHVTCIGCFTSTPADPADQTLMFIPNPDFKGAVGPFQNNLIRHYTAEYHLEIWRQHRFARYPSRLHAIFLWGDEEEANKYLSRHPEHVACRVLKRVKTVGPHIFSVHDCSWVDFLRTAHSMDDGTLESVSCAYWTGDTVAMYEGRIKSMGKPWFADPIMEVLLIGRVEFYDRTLTE